MKSPWTLVLGDNEVIDGEAAIVVEGENVFRLRERQYDGTLVVDFDLRAEDESRIAAITGNYVHYVAEGYEYRNRKGVAEVIEKATGRVVAQVREIAPDRLKVIGKFWVKGYNIDISEDGLVAGGLTMSGNRIQGFGKAIEFGRGHIGIGVVG